MSSENQATAFVGTLPEQMQDIVMAGIPLIEFRAYLGEYITRMIGGLFVAKVKMDSSNGRPRPLVTWQTQNNAIVRIESDKKGIAIGFCPDDPWWHNRVLMMDWVDYRVSARYSEKGVMSGINLLQEIAILSKHLRMRTPIFRISKNGTPISDRETYEDCEAEIESLNQMAPMIDKASGMMRIQSIRKDKYKIDEVLGTVWRPTVKALIKKYRNLEYGWTSCLEFREIQNSVMKEVKESDITQVQGSAITPEDLKAAFASMPAADKAAILKSFMGGSAPAPAVQPPEPSEDLVATPNTSLDEIAASEEAASLVPGRIYNRSEITKLSKEQLVVLGTRYNIPHLMTLNKTQIIESVLKAQKLPGTPIGVGESRPTDKLAEVEV